MQWVSINNLYLLFYLDFYFYHYRVQSNWEMLAAAGSVVCILQHSQLLSGPTTDNCIPANSCNLIRINVQDTRIIHTYLQSYSRSRNISKWYVDSVSLPIHILQSDVGDEIQAQYNMPQTYTAGTHRHTAKGRRVLPIALLLEEPRLPGPSQSEYYYYSGLPTHPIPIHCQEDLLDSYTKTETKAKAMR